MGVAVAGRDYSGLILVAVGAAVAYMVVRSLKASAAAVTGNTTGETGTSKGGILPGVGAILAGDEQFSQTVKEQTLELGSTATIPAAPAKGSTDPLAYISGGIVVPQNGGSVKRGLFSQTVRLVAELTNSASTAWTGELRLDVDEDYLLKDAKGTYSRVVTVAPRSTLRLDIDYLLRGGAMIREPNLYVNSYAGTKHLGSHTVVVT
jgi:hypothetical protein